MNFPHIQVPTFPTFPNFPQFTPIFPTIPPIPPINIPTPDEIINKNVGSNEQFSGIIVQSSSGYGKDKDGKLVKTGGTTVVTNNNGDVQKFSGKQFCNYNLYDTIVFYYNVFYYNLRNYQLVTTRLFNYSDCLVLYRIAGVDSL